jgi:hypothetical protein
LSESVERSEMLVAQAGDSSGTHSKKNARRWKPLPGNDL